MPVLISLAPDGGLQLELPGTAGTSRVIPLKRTERIDPVETIRRVLLAQAQGATSIGEDGAPTRDQVKHWERHASSFDSKCAFCQFDLALARGLSGKAERAVIHRSSHLNDIRYAEGGREGGRSAKFSCIPEGETKAKAAARASRASRNAPTICNVELDF